MEIKLYYTKDFTDYELLDTGEGEKLEKVGSHNFVRPHEDAVWPKTLSNNEWENIAGKFWSAKTGAKPGWTFSHLPKSDLGKKWEMEYKGIKFLATPTPFRHFGFFPEQASHWDFIENKIKNSQRPVKFLNLFGYTGLASLFALRAGAEVTHVDASKQSLNWAKENENLSRGVLDGKTMRVIEDDVLKFLEKEIKRGNKYDAVIMDPPKFGRGPKGETWKLEEDLPKLLELVKKVLSDKPIFVILTSYNTDSSALSLGYALSEVLPPGEVQVGEMCVLEKSKERLISLAHTSIWQAN